MEQKDHLSVKFFKSGRGKAKCPPDPAYPSGIDLNVCGEKDQWTCQVDLPYPAPECGLYVILCDLCKNSVAVTAAGRMDDPKSVKFPCKIDPKTNGKIN